MEQKSTTSKVKTIDLQVCNDYWIQNSRPFPGFSQNNSVFLQTKGYQIGDQ